MFNVRVYGILINEDRQVLVSDEIIRGKYYTKFPGGGLEPGEGTRDCLKREFKEELNLLVAVEDHLYTTDYYQQSAFNPDDQLLSIYYYVTPLEPLLFPLTHSEMDDSQKTPTIYDIQASLETFRFMDLSGFSSESMSLPVDKIVADLIVKTVH